MPRYVVAPNRTEPAARIRSALCSSNAWSIGMAMTLPPGPSVQPSRLRMLLTTTLLMTVSSARGPSLHTCRGRQRLGTHRCARDFFNDGRIDEARDVADPPVADPEHVDGTEPPLALDQLAAHQAGLAVEGARLQAPGRLEQPLAEEPDDHLPAVEPRRQRRHREACVLGQQVGQPVDVRGLPGGDEL